ncbi:MAG: cob(I)alamin adenosyltransferase [Chlamydiales bacterium]|jgi:cob(I)alamin adenosyltransferase
MKIYTRTGDSGETGLLNGSRVAKSHPRVEAYGTIDECNSTLGAAISFLDSEKHKNLYQELFQVQKVLFDIGAALALPLSEATEKQKTWIRTDYSKDTKELESWIDEMDKTLPPLHNFILPGGHPSASMLHLARSVCRRAERFVTGLCKKDKDLDLATVTYLNRLSDYLFTAARHANALHKTPETIWKGSS